MIAFFKGFMMGLSIPAVIGCVMFLQSAFLVSFKNVTLEA